MRIRQLYEVRGAIDALAARLAAGRSQGRCRRARSRSRRRCTPGARSTSKPPCPALIALDVDFHSAIYRLAGNPAIEEMIAPQWPHMRRSMATVLAELDYRANAWAEHETIAAHVLAGDAKAAETRRAGARDRRRTNDGRSD